MLAVHYEKWEINFKGKQKNAEGGRPIRVHHFHQKIIPTTNSVKIENISKDDVSDKGRYHRTFFINVTFEQPGLF